MNKDISEFLVSSLFQMSWYCNLQYGRVVEKDLIFVVVEFGINMKYVDANRCIGWTVWWYSITSLNRVS